MSFENPSDDLKTKRMHVLSKGVVNNETYEVDDSFRPGVINANEVHTTSELVALLEADSKVQFDGIFVCGTSNSEKKPRMVRMNREKFLETWKKNSKKTGFKKVFESFDRGFDFGNSANLVGDDYVPILGGPFNKQLYLHDSLRMFALGFHAYHHDPLGRGLTHITRDFTLGRGFRVDSKNDQAIAYWRAFEKANKLQQYFRTLACELSYNGEVMIWWLPDNLTAVAWQDPADQMPDKGIIPRIKPIDPSTVWEIITFPEDIDRVVAYQQVFPTQYNMYTARVGQEQVPSSKFVIQQIPADQVDHWKINCASNEKRGRSDLFPCFGYMKRLRDSVNYSIIALQKAAAWAIDTTIEGSTSDMQAYVDDQNSQPTMNAAGSEFVHTSKISRKFQANEGSSSSSFPAFEWALNMVCMAYGIPTSYLGLSSHTGGSGSRAGALVGTEPVTKKFESRQLVYTDIVQKMWDRVMKLNGIEAECEITFPELITQDRSQKIKDTALAQELDVISHESMSIIVANELGITNYNYDTEQSLIDAERGSDARKDTDAVLIAPLTAKPIVPTAGSPSPTKPSLLTDKSTQAKPSAVTGPEQVKINKDNTKL